MLNWSSQFSILIFLDSNGYTDGFGAYECLLAVNPTGAFFSKLPDAAEWHKSNKDWLFGHIAYDYKNQLESRLATNHPARLGFPTFSFFCPEVVCYIRHNSTQLVIESLYDAPDSIFETIFSTPFAPVQSLPVISFKARTTEESYMANIAKLKEHIRNGDCYELNYCNEYYADTADISPVSVFAALNKLSKAPFATFYRNEDKYLMCASPERYICNRASTITSQPIKGTAKRSVEPREDEHNREMLSQSIKDKAENVMITDLVRNDMARTCKTGSVTVNELFAIYSFPQVHQMISTISGQLRVGADFGDVIKNSFPMGSMTGAPKIKVMELIDSYEDTARELFSGTVGYVSPEGDFDFNVIIRSLFYNSTRGYLSYQAGGAITYDSNARAEWEEMRLKGWALERIFQK